MNKKKVLFVVHQMNHGGVQKALLSALDAIDYSKNEVTVYVRKNRTDLLKNINQNVDRVIVNEDRTHYYRKPSAVMFLVLKEIYKFLGNKNKCNEIQKELVKYINQSQMEYEKKHYFNNDLEYDVAVSYIQGYTAQFVAEYVNAKRKIMFYHGSTDETHELHELIMSEYDAIVGVNANVKKILEDLYPSNADKMAYLENYVDADMIEKKSTEYKVGRKDNCIILCSCGRLTTVKGFDMAVEAARLLKEKGLKFFWWFVGDGPEREKLEARIKEYGLENYIVITGMQENPYPYMNCCDIYIQPSREESHSLTIMEAFRLKKPVVSTATVGGTFLVQDSVNGIVVDIISEKIAEGIRLLNDDKNLFLNIKDILNRTDYSKDIDEYKAKWNKLLEG